MSAGVWPLATVGVSLWSWQGLLTNHFALQQKLVSKERHGAKITKKYDIPATPLQRVLTDQSAVTEAVKAKLREENEPLNPIPFN